MHKDKVKAIKDSIVRNSKYVFPILVIVIVAATVAFALKAGDNRANATQTGDVAQGSVDTLQSVIVDSVGSIIMPASPEPTAEPVEPDADVPLVANEDGELYTAVATYYNSMALGDEAALKALYDEISENDLMRYAETSKYLDYYTALDIYTKPGYEEGSQLAYVYYKVRFQNHTEEFPGYQTLYLCKKEDGTYYIKNESNFSEGEIAYIKKVTEQADVVDFTNRVNVEYQDLMVAKPEMLNYLSELGNIINAAIAEVLTENNATAEVNVEAPAEPTPEPVATEEPVVNVIQYATATTTVNVRESDSEQADRLGRISEGARIQVQEVLINGWTKVSYEGVDGFIKSEYLRMEETADNLQIVGTVTATTTINIRSQASQNSIRVGSLAQGASLDWLGDEGDWCMVSYEGQLAYVKAEYVTKKNK